jgi:uncharacterized membrane protein YqiK
VFVVDDDRAKRASATGRGLRERRRSDVSLIWLNWSGAAPVPGTTLIRSAIGQSRGLHIHVAHAAHSARHAGVGVVYRRSTKEMAFVRTGLGGQKVVINGGAFVVPIFHGVTPVNMRTQRFEIRRDRDRAVITKDRMRMDVNAEFFVRVAPNRDSVAAAAQTLGRRTTDADALRELVEGKFVDALRAIAAEMPLEELHEKRSEYATRVRKAVAETLAKNGLEAEDVSITQLDQTNIEFFNPSNTFDAEGLTRLTEEAARGGAAPGA